MKSLSLLFVCFVTSAIGVFAQSLEIHHISVGAGDASLIVQRNVDSLKRRVNTKAGAVVPDSNLLMYALNNNVSLKGTVSRVIMVDMGPASGLTSIQNYMNEMGVSTLNYITVSHYHEDHIGCSANLIKAGVTIYDRGKKSHPTSGNYANYRAKAAAAITTTVGTTITMAPVSTGITGGNIVMTCVAANKQVQGDTTALTGGISENDYGVAWLLTYGKFRYFTGGDLGGEDHAPYIDVESSVAKAIGHVCAMKINHHGSQYSSNATFIDSLLPKSCIISCGTRHHHPTAQATNNIKRATSDIQITRTGHDYIYIVQDTNAATQSKFVTLEHVNTVMQGVPKQNVISLPAILCH